MFQSLRNHNYRLYFVGQTVSSVGTFMQTIAQAWLVLQLTGSGTALGLVTTLQYGPLLVLGGPAGVLLDRVDRRRLYIVTECVMGAEALLLGLLVTTGSVQLWMVYALALVLGVVTAVDQPIRQTIVLDIVGPADLANAVSLNMTLGSVSRAVGPALAGVTIAIVGVGPCFLLNAVSYVAMIVALLLMRTSELHPAVRESPGRGQFRAGLVYVWSHSELRSILIIVALVFGLAWEFEVVVPLLAKFTFAGTAATYGILASAFGVGAVLGGLEAARRATSSRAALAIAGALLGVCLWCATFAPTVGWSVVALVATGITGVVFASVANTRLQLNTIPRMRGRVMALYSIAVLGTRVIGGPIVGWFGQEFGARAALGLGAVTMTIVLPTWFAVTSRTHARRVDGTWPATE